MNNTTQTTNNRTWNLTKEEWRLLSMFLAGNNAMLLIFCLVGLVYIFRRRYSRRNSKKMDYDLLSAPDNHRKQNKNTCCEYEEIADLVTRDIPTSKKMPSTNQNPYSTIANYVTQTSDSQTNPIIRAKSCPNVIDGSSEYDVLKLRLVKNDCTLPRRNVNKRYNHPSGKHEEKLSRNKRTSRSESLRLIGGRISHFLVDKYNAFKGRNSDISSQADSVEQDVQCTMVDVHTETSGTQPRFIVEESCMATEIQTDDNKGRKGNYDYELAKAIPIEDEETQKT